jgi:hypothetical protein
MRLFANLKTFGHLRWPRGFNGLGFPRDMTENNPTSRRLDYARVSTYGQTLDAQLAQLLAEGCPRIYRENVNRLSG